jgi:hypothetical protein
MWEPRRLTTLWAPTACYRDSSTFYHTISSATVESSTAFRKAKVMKVVFIAGIIDSHMKVIFIRGLVIIPFEASLQLHKEIISHDRTAT